jgi:hypothetical protein
MLSVGCSWARHHLSQAAVIRVRNGSRSARYIVFVLGNRGLETDEECRIKTLLECRVLIVENSCWPMPHCLMQEASRVSWAWFFPRLTLQGGGVMLGCLDHGESHACSLCGSLGIALTSRHSRASGPGVDYHPCVQLRSDEYWFQGRCSDDGRKTDRKKLLQDLWNLLVGSAIECVAWPPS